MQTRFQQGKYGTPTRVAGFLAAGCADDEQVGFAGIIAAGQSALVFVELNPAPSRKASESARGRVSTLMDAHGGGSVIFAEAPGAAGCTGRPTKWDLAVREEQSRRLTAAIEHASCVTRAAEALAALVLRADEGAARVPVQARRVVAAQRKRSKMRAGNTSKPKFVHEGAVRAQQQVLLAALAALTALLKMAEPASNTTTWP